MTAPETYVCDRHGTAPRCGTPCPDCVEAFANRRRPDLMTGDERAAELRWWGTILTIPFEDLHQRIQELVGRPVLTPELAEERLFARLVEEARTRTHPTMQEILEKVPRGKPMIITRLGGRRGGRMTVCERCAYLQQQVTDRDRFISLDQAEITRRGTKIEELVAQRDRLIQTVAVLGGAERLAQCPVCLADRTQGEWHVDDCLVGKGTAP